MTHSSSIPAGAFATWPSAPLWSAVSPPLPVAIDRFFTTDVFMHTWELARATGQDETLDPQRCASLLEQLEPLDELLRSSGQFGPRVEVPDDADAQIRMLAFIGRDPY